MSEIFVSTLRRKRDGSDLDGSPYFHHYPQAHAYQVVARRRPRSAVIREIGWQIKRSGTGLSYILPVRDAFIGEEMEAPLSETMFGETIRWTEPLLEVAVPYIEGAAYPAELLVSKDTE